MTLTSRCLKSSGRDPCETAARYTRLLWWATAPEKLPEVVIKACKDPATTLMVSVASAWELQIKAQIGKIRFATSLEQLFQTQQANGVELLSIVLPHVIHLAALPLHHKDPFDRLLIAQAQFEDTYLASADAIFRDYRVKLLW